MAVLKSFRDLDVYPLARKEAKKLFELTKRLPREEICSLVSQVRRCSRAVTAMLAEAWAKRRYPAAFVSKIDDALAEANETQAWLDHALDCEYISEAEHEELDASWQRIGGMLNNMIERTDTFCKSISVK